MTVVDVRPFEPRDQEAARAVVLAGMREEWGEAYDPSLSPDVDDIARSYAGDVFLVAVTGGRVIGTGALTQRDGGSARIERMSVSREHRRAGIGSRILAGLLDVARASGCREVLLSTADGRREAHAFWRSSGFEPVGRTRAGTLYRIAV